MEVTKNTAISLPVWISTERMEPPAPVVMVLQEHHREVILLMVMVKARMAVQLYNPPGMPPEQNMTQAITITVLERMTLGIKPVTRRITANRTVPQPITVQFPQKLIPLSNTMIEQAMPVMTRKPIRKATQRPISTLMVVITRQNTEYQKLQKKRCV